ncbi:MAG: nucleotidyltransferase domain-containing protein [Candidatus Brocadia sp.]|nr:nucleotidyltransferase domain-containing protein [Candidatus Brocadia sp.]
MTNRFGLEESDIQAICAIFAHYPQVEKAILYGSRAKGNFKNGSDIDLTLFGGEDLTLDILYSITDEIDDLLLPYTFDLSIFRQISDPDVIDHIQRVGVVFYQKATETSHV